MFRMEIESQLNMNDRTILAGKPGFVDIPNELKIENDRYKIVGISQGIKLPYMSVEIEKTKKDLIGKVAVG